MKLEGSVPRRECLSQSDFIRDYLVPQQPVIIAGATKHWKAHSAWTLEYLLNAIKRKEINVKESTTNVHPDLFSNRPCHHSQMDLSKYIELLRSTQPERSRKYLSGDELKLLDNYTNWDPALMSLRNDFELPSYCSPQEVKTIGFWLSSQGVVASLHYDADGSHNLNAQIKGKKRVLLFSPNQALYPFSGFSPSGGSSNFSQVNIVDPDEERFPGFRSARCVEAIIEEGDMLFIPSYWYHAVFHLGEINININFWWQPDYVRLTKTSFREMFLTILAGALTRGRQVPGNRELRTAMLSLPPETAGLLARMENLISQQYRM